MTSRPSAPSAPTFTAASLAAPTPCSSSSMPCWRPSRSPRCPTSACRPPHRRGWGSLYDALAAGRLDVAALRATLAQDPRHRQPAGLRCRPERLAPLRRRGESGARLLLPSVPPLGRAADRGRVGVPVAGPAQLHARQLDRPARCPARPSDARTPTPSRSSRSPRSSASRPAIRGHAPVRLRCRLRLGPPDAGLGRAPRCRPRPPSCRPLLLRRPAASDTVAQGRPPAQARRQVRLQGSGDLAPADCRARRRGRAVRHGAGARLGRAASQAAAHPGRGTRKTRPIVRGTVVLVEVSRLPARPYPPQLLWLWWAGPGAPDLDLLWRAYVRRFDLEHTLRFCKQSLGWTTPRVRHPEQADRWTWLVVAAYTQLRLARPWVADRRLPWERPLDPGAADAVPRPSCPFRAAATGRHAGPRAKTVRALAGPTQREPIGARSPATRP